MDMEFGGICGTWQRMKVPVEAGVVIHDRENDVLSFAGRKFTYDIDITIWKNITDELGRTIGKNPCSLNPAKKGSEVEGQRKIRLDPEQRKTAYRTTVTVHRELQDFMRGFNGLGISTLVFFAADYERTTLAQAKVRLEGFKVHDLQRDIKTAFSQKEVMSLDRLSYVIDFVARNSTISSRHFRYGVPSGFRDWLEPHTAVGDAARMFLLSQELEFYPDELRERVNQYLVKCEENKKAGSGNGEEPDECSLPGNSMI